MSSFHQVTIGGYPSGGLMTDRKPLMLPNEAWSTLENAYVWRERTKKRIGTDGMGQLQRSFTAINFFLTGAASWTFNLLVVSGYVATTNNANPGKITTTYPHNLSTGDKVIVTGIVGATGYNNKTFTITVVDSLNFTVGTNAAGYGAYISGGYFISNRSLSATEPNAQLVPGAFSITFSAATYTDNGMGSIVDSLSNVVGTINYATGSLTLTNTSSGGVATVITYAYAPGLQVMGILKQDVSTLGIDQTLFFDTKYCYIFSDENFTEFLPGTTWSAPNNTNGTNTNFFWAANYQGATPNARFFFVTNNYINPSTPAADPIRYFNPNSGGSWNSLTPAIDGSNYLQQCLILIPYYGRLLALNTWEGDDVTDSVNYFARCRFSQIGNPVATDSWRSDMFGLGGYLDAPTNETIVGAAFFRNTLIVFFEYSTWQLRYIGEYGLPFIFERISSDFGAISTFSSIVFDQGVMAISDRGIIQASAGGVTRLDEQIPETVFSFQIQNNSPDFVHGIRDFEKEVVYWNYLDTSNAEDTQVFPNSTLLFNYRNNTWAIFRDTISSFGIGQFTFSITWDSLTVSWDGDAEWDDSDDQQYVDYVVAGNQVGFISIYENQNVSTPVYSPVIFSASLIITGINFSATPNATFTVPNHNLANGEIIYLAGMLWSGTDPGLNNQIYNVTVVDQNTISLGEWNGTNYNSVNPPSYGTYIGGGQITLLPRMNMVGKDFNPFQAQGNQFKLSYIDFQMDSNNNFPSIPAITIQCFVNSYLNEQANTIPVNMMTPSLTPTNQEVLNSSQNVNYIQGATNANPCVITSYNHGLINGTLIQIANVQGMTQINTSVSMTNYNITVIDANNFSLNGVDSTSYGTYIATTGIWNTVPTQGQTYTPGSQYAWYRFYSTQFGQYLRVALTYDDSLMNQISTHQVGMELNAMNFWFRPGGRLIN